MHEGRVPGAFAPLSTACAVDLPWPVGGLYTSCAQRPRRARLGRAQGGACKVYRRSFSKNIGAPRACGLARACPVVHGRAA